MCGIAGIIDWTRDLHEQQPVLEAMEHSLKKRGPDDTGLWTSTRAALAHRRLSIIDPESGQQPMTRTIDGKTLAITYNGELYNMPELRRNLEQRGYHFETNCDTEVILVAYIEWGSGCVERFNGIFAFGIWDGVNQCLFLARDPLGVKPLFYAKREGVLAFGSELKAVLEHPQVEPVVDRDGLGQIFAMGPARTPGHGVFKDVHSLRPGHTLRFNRSGTHLECYWELESVQHTDDLETTTEKVRHLLKDAVQRQLISDVPVSTLLSGGLDSSAITAFASQKLGPGLDTFSIDYVGNDRHFEPNKFQRSADGPWVQRVSDYFGTEQHDVYVDTPELATTLRAALHARDLPGMADVDSSLYLFSREVKKTVKVALAGEGADEVFGGYPWYEDEAALKQLGDPPGHRFPWIRMVKKRTRLLHPDIARAVQPSHYVSDRFHEALAEVPGLPGEDAQQQRLRRMTYLNITRFMPVLLDRMDRMSMAHGLEVRVPFTDHRLVQYVFNIPWELKTTGGMRKGILRRALRGILPEAVRTREKSPYPKTHNPTFRNAVRDSMLEILSDPGSPLRELVHVDTISAAAESGGEDYDPAWFSQLMGGPQLLAYLTQVDLWLRDYGVRIKL